jgi:hypothetical protein
VRLAPVDHLAGHDQLLRVAEPDHGRQPRAAADVGEQADADLHDPRHGVLGHRAEVACQRQLERAAECGTVDLADGRLGHLLEQVPPGEQRTAERTQPAGVLGQVPQVVEVHARGEHRSLAAQHEHPHVGIGGRLLDRAPELRDQLAVERVALLGTVQNQMADRAAVLCVDQ